MKPIEVKALSEYRLHLSFDNGVSGIVNLKELVKKGIFIPLQDMELFNNVYVTKSSVAWSQELEIDALALYAKILNKKPSEVRDRNLQDATD